MGSVTRFSPAASWAWLAYNKKRFGDLEQLRIAWRISREASLRNVSKKWPMGGGRWPRARRWAWGRAQGEGPMVSMVRMVVASSFWGQIGREDDDLGRAVEVELEVRGSIVGHHCWIYRVAGPVCNTAVCLQCSIKEWRTRFLRHKLSQWMSFSVVRLREYA